MREDFGPRVEAASPSSIVRFTYTNHKSCDHVYEIDVESFQYGPFVKDGIDRSENPVSAWVMHGHVVTRDGDARPEMGGNRRRTFLLDGVRDLSVIS